VCRSLPQVFSLDQELVTDYQGQNLLLKVRNILAVDRAGEQASVPRGVMAPITAFVFDPASGSGIKAGPCRIRPRSSQAFPSQLMQTTAGQTHAQFSIACN